MTPQRAIAHPAGLTHHVGHQSLIARHILSGYDHALAHARMSVEHSLYLSQLDAEAPHLHLLVYAPQVLQLARGRVAHQVARPVEARTRLITERVRNESVGGQLRAVQVAAGEARTADV